MTIIRNTNLTNVNDLIFYLDAVNPRSYPRSGSVWYDLSSNGNHFTLFNSPTYVQNGTIGTYLTFNGTNQYARSANAINFNAYSAVTIEIGYRSTVTNATQILYETTGTGGSTATGGITLLMNANGTSTVANSYLSMWQGYGPRSFGYTVSTNSTFNSVVETFVNGSDSTGRQAYVNGTTAQFFTNTAVTVVTSATTTGLSFANTWTFVASRVGTSNFFRGDIAYIRAWGRKLGTTDIATNVSAIAARQPQSYTGASILTSDPSNAPPVPTFSLTDTGPIIAVSSTAFSYVAMPSGPRTLLNYITSFGVNGSSSNDGSPTWNNAYATLNYVASPITSASYFTQYNRVRVIDGDGSADSADWTVFNFGVVNGNGDYDGTSDSNAHFGGESTASGGRGISSSTVGRVWGFNTTVGWVLLYQLPLGSGSGSSFNHTNGSWFSSGGTLVTSGNGKRGLYDTESITHIGFSVT